MHVWRLIPLSACLLAASTFLLAQPATPTQDPAYANIWYGSVPPGGDQGPVVVFIHGLGGTASYFWVNNDMYSMAYTARYRTAFISMNADNTANTNTIAQNGIMIKSTLPAVAQHYLSKKLNMVGHSKGGLDIQYAIAYYPAIRGLVKQVFTLATPNAGSHLADWAFGPGKPIAYQLGLLSPGLASLQTTYVQTYRATFDPIFAAAGIPFFYLAGTAYSGNPLTMRTGPILQGLTGEANDGMVAPSETVLPSAWATSLGTIPDNHFLMGTGAAAFSFIQPYVQ